MSQRLGGTTFGYCKEHGDYCGKTCPFCQIKVLEKQNSKIKETFKKIISYHIGINAPLGMKQLIKFLKELLGELD